MQIYKIYVQISTNIHKYSYKYIQIYIYMYIVHKIIMHTIHLIHQGNQGHVVEFGEPAGTSVFGECA